MRLLSQFFLVLLCALVSVFSAAVFAEENKTISSVVPEVASVTAPVTIAPPFLEPKFLGVYASDGYFKAPGKITRSFSGGTDAGPRLHGRPAFVPPFVDLHSSESVIEDVAPHTQVSR